MHGCWLCRPHREQARSHNRFLALHSTLNWHLSPCGSLLAMAVCQATPAFSYPASFK
ncbi:hypothetical protein EMIT043CA1_20312 [Pseudomonas brassicacearum]